MRSPQLHRLNHRNILDANWIKMSPIQPVRSVTPQSVCTPWGPETEFRAIRPGEARRDTAAPGARLIGTLRPVWRAALTPMRFASTDSAPRAEAAGYKSQTARRLSV